MYSIFSHPVFSSVESFFCGVFSSSKHYSNCLFVLQNGLSPTLSVYIFGVFFLVYFHSRDFQDSVFFSEMMLFNFSYHASFLRRLFIPNPPSENINITCIVSIIVVLVDLLLSLILYLMCIVLFVSFPVINHVIAVLTLILCTLVNTFIVNLSLPHTMLQDRILND